MHNLHHVLSQENGQFENIYNSSYAGATNNKFEEQLHLFNRIP